MLITLNKLGIKTQGATGKYITKYYSYAREGSIIEDKHLVYRYDIDKLEEIAFQKIEQYENLNGAFYRRAVKNANNLLNILSKYREQLQQ